MPTTRITEAEMATVVRKILQRQENKSATFSELREIVPRRLHLTRADRTASPSRPGEELWEQIIRNIVSHKREGFEAVPGGVRLYGVRGPKPHPKPRPKSAHEMRHAA